MGVSKLEQSGKGFINKAEIVEYSGVSCQYWGSLSLSLQVDVNYITSSLITFTHIIIRTPSHSHHCAGKDGIRLFLGLSICDFISLV